MVIHHAPFDHALTLTLTRTLTLNPILTLNPTLVRTLTLTLTVVDHALLNKHGGEPEHNRLPLL